MKQRLDIENTEETTIHTDCLGHYTKDTENEDEDNEDFEEYTQRTH